MHTAIPTPLIIFFLRIVVNINAVNLKQKSDRYGYRISAQVHTVPVFTISMIL